MDEKTKLVWLGLYSAFFGVLFTGALAFGTDLSNIGELAAKIYTLTTGPLWLVATFRWSIGTGKE